MAAGNPFLMRLVSSSVAVANRAGGVIRSIMKTGSLNVVDKGGSGEYDPQTEADRASQKCIIGSLLRVYPNLRIIGEEESMLKTASSGQTGKLSSTIIKNLNKLKMNDS